MDQFRLKAIGGGAVFALVWIIILSLILDSASPMAALLLDINGNTYPISVQNVMWITFFVGAGELLARHLSSKHEQAFFNSNFLPEDEETILLAEDLPDIYRALSQCPRDGFLPRLLKRTVIQFQTSRSVDQTNSLLNSSIELFMHEIDLRYNMSRYIMWLIPTLGFIGTVMGIADALGYAGSADFQDPALLNNVTTKLAVAFNTTLLALIMSGILVLALNVIQGQEEMTLNRSGQYCLDNLINRLYEEN